MKKSAPIYTPVKLHLLKKRRNSMPDENAPGTIFLEFVACCYGDA